MGYAYLFDLEADPTETTNLLDDYPEVAEGLEELLYAYLKEGVRSYYTASLDDDAAEENFISVRLSSHPFGLRMEKGVSIGVVAS